MKELGHGDVLAFRLAGVPPDPSHSTKNPNQFGIMQIIRAKGQDKAYFYTLFWETAIAEQCWGIDNNGGIRSTPLAGIQSSPLQYINLVVFLRENITDQDFRAFGKEMSGSESAPMAYALAEKVAYVDLSNYRDIRPSVAYIENLNRKRIP